MVNTGLGWAVWGRHLHTVTPLRLHTTLHILGEQQQPELKVIWLPQTLQLQIFTNTSTKIPQKYCVIQKLLHCILIKEGENFHEKVCKANTAEFDSALWTPGPVVPVLNNRISESKTVGQTSKRIRFHITISPKWLFEQELNKRSSKI